MSHNFYKTVFKVVVLTDDGPLPDGMDLGSVAYYITEGGATGKWHVESSEQLSPDQMKLELDAVGTDREFFLLDQPSKEENNE